MSATPTAEEDARPPFIEPGSAPEEEVPTAQSNLVSRGAEPEAKQAQAPAIAHDLGKEADLKPDLAPPPRWLTSRLGRLVDRATYLDLLVAALGVLTISSCYFWLAPAQHGLRELNEGLTGAIYFSIVTFTSLGYGDFQPVGFGRVIASLVVLTGLALTALLIGKVASERQANTLLLIHTSDTQRRIAEFGDRLATLRHELADTASLEQIDLFCRHLEDHLRLTRAMGNYLTFNARQASVLEFGNFTVLIGLYSEIKESFRALKKLLLKSAALGSSLATRRLLKNLEELQRIVLRMRALHEASDPSLAKSRSRTSRWLASMTIPESSAARGARLRAKELSGQLGAELLEARRWMEKAYHPQQVQRVFAECPAGPTSSWPQGVHKKIADKLGISNSVAQKCITELLAAKRLPKKQRKQTTG